MMPCLIDLLVIDLQVAHGGGIHPPDGPPICTALNFLPSFIRAYFIDDLVDGNTHGTSARPPLAIFPARAKTFVPLLSSVPMAANASARSG